MMLNLRKLLSCSCSTLSTYNKCRIPSILWSSLKDESLGAYRPPNHEPNLFFILQRCSFHTSHSLNEEVKGLSEFFDEKENWGQTEVRVGRSWKKEELRLKSNSDLHKLWYVLLKEKNMLLTMEEESKRLFELFPNPERIDKVKESMINLEVVVRERNKAYMLLETGETGERPGDTITDTFGRVVYRRSAEYGIPDHMNPRYLSRPTVRHPVQTEFYRLLREKEHGRALAKKFGHIRSIAQLFSRFPDLDIEALQQKYPDVDVEKVRKMKISAGHHLKNKS